MYNIDSIKNGLRILYVKSFALYYQNVSIKSVLHLVLYNACTENSKYHRREHGEEAVIQVSVLE